MTPSSFLSYWSLFVKFYIFDTAFQKWRTRHLGPLEGVGGPVAGKVALVTGGTSGIGKATAVELGRRGATVILPCRDVSRGENVADEIRTAQKVSGRKADVKVLEMDLSSLSSVEACVKSVEALNLPLHILVNNGGIYNLGGAAFSPEETLDLQSATRLKTTFAVYVSGSLNVATAVGFGGRCGCLDKKHAGSRKQTSSGYELHMATNHISHFSLTLRLLPLLRKSAAASPGEARIVNVSSHLHFLSQLRANDMHLTKSFSSQTAYANSKCAQVLATKLLRQQLPGSGVEAFAVHPGIVRTSITRSLPTLLQNGQDLIKFFHFSPEEGARSVVYCATSDKAPDEAPDSWGYFSSDCTPMKPGVQARSETLASFVWRFSVHAADLPASLDISQKV